MKMMCQGWSVSLFQASLPVEEALGTECVEPHHPVPHDLPCDPADLRRLSSRGVLIDRHQSQQTPCLRSVLRPAGEPTKSRGVEVAPERDGRGERPCATLNRTCSASNSPNESRLQRLGTRRRRQRSFNAPDDGKHLLGIVLAAIEDGLRALPFPTGWAARNVSNQPRAATFISGVWRRVLWRIRQRHPMGWGEL